MIPINRSPFKDVVMSIITKFLKDHRPRFCRKHFSAKTSAQHRHQLPFRYRTKSISDIPISKVDKSDPNDPNKILWNSIVHTGVEPTVIMSCIRCITTALRGFTHVESDMGYPTKVYSNVWHNVGLCTLQSDILRSDIRLSPISLITDIGLSSHLWG